MFLIGSLYLQFILYFLNFLYLHAEWSWIYFQEFAAGGNVFLYLFSAKPPTSNNTVKRLLYFLILVFHSLLPLNYSLAQT